MSNWKSKTNKVVKMKYENPFKKSLTGKEAKNWISYNNTHPTKYTSLTKTMNKFFNIDDDRIYMFKICDGVPIAVEVEERGIKYEVPCDD